MTADPAPNEPVDIDWAAAEAAKSASEVEERIVEAAWEVEWKRVDADADAVARAINSKEQRTETWVK
jgi:hypothetical protein